MIIEMQPVTERVINKINTSYMSKQILVLAASGLMCLCGGFTYGYSSVLIPRLKLDQLIPYSEHYDSWIAAVAPLAMAFGCIFAGALSDKLGRKYTNILLLWPFMIGFLVLAFASSVTQLLLGRLLTGISTGVYRSLGAVYLVEITDPKNRAIFQFFLSLWANVGILGCHIIGGHLSVRQSCLIFTIPIFVAFILLVFTKESPLWLISKGRIAEGIESFEWYRCMDEASQKELNDVLEKQNTKRDNLNCIETMQIIFSKTFMKAFLTGFIIFTAVQFCGLNSITFYAPQLLRPTFSDKIDVFVLMISIDSLRVLSNFAVIPVLKFCPRRKSFFAFTSAVVLSLIFITVYLIVDPTGFTWLLLVCMTIFTVVSAIMISLAWTVVAEIFSNEVRGIGSGMSAATSFLLLFMSVKLTPEIMGAFGIVAVYATFAIVTLASMIALYFLLPDTDDKSLQEIEDSYNK